MILLEKRTQIPLPDKDLYGNIVTCNALYQREALARFTYSFITQTSQL